MNKQASILLFLFTTSLFACNTDNNNDANNENAIAAPTALSYEVIKVYPHDTSSYTQGLEWNGNKLIESTGLEGKSVLQILDSNMKPLVDKVKLDKDYFGRLVKTRSAYESIAVLSRI